MKRARVFSLEDQRAFAELSGDWNPVHVDPLAARRTLFGRPVVHGVHALCWVLDQWLGEIGGRRKLASIRADFLGAIGVDETATASWREEKESATLIGEIHSGAARSVYIEARWSEEPSAEVHGGLPRAAKQPRVCLDRTMADMRDGVGELELYLDPGLAGRLFPNIFRWLPEGQLAVLLATTRLVGMECPGLHSLLSSVHIESTEQTQTAGYLRYRVERCDPRFSTVQLAVQGPGNTGKIKTFLRPAPAAQLSQRALRPMIVESEFSGHRAVVVGGSRGLGEVAARILALGGANVLITYQRGKSDAQRVASDIESAGGKVAIEAYDVLSESGPVGSFSGSGPTDLYYFATPPIFVASRRTFSGDLFRRFADHYVTGFWNTVRAFDTPAGSLLRILYPSSVAVDAPPLDMGEYAAAKAAGESVAMFVASLSPATRVLTPRFSRLRTDQTGSILPVASEDPAGAVLASLRELRDTRSRK